MRTPTLLALVLASIHATLRLREECSLRLLHFGLVVACAACANAGTTLDTAEPDGETPDQQMSGGGSGAGEQTSGASSPSACGNGVLEAPTEHCDTAIATGEGACPTGCDDRDPCTTNELLESGTCQAHCTLKPRENCINIDGFGAEVWVYQAEEIREDGDFFRSHTGENVEGGRQARVDDHDYGALTFGPYTTAWGHGRRRAIFRIKLDVSSSSTGHIAKIEAVAHTPSDNYILAERWLKVSDFPAPGTYTDLTLDFVLPENVEGESYQASVITHWFDVVDMTKDKVTVHELPPEE